MLVLATAGLALACGGESRPKKAAGREVVKSTEKREDIMEEARRAADQLIRQATFPPHYTLQYLRTENEGNEVRIIYEKVFLEEVDELPNTVVEVYDTREHTTRFIPNE